MSAVVAPLPIVPPYYVVLLHYPIINRHGEKVTTAVTNMDIHDISRSARTYGAKGYFLVTPIQDQHDLIERILDHWRREQSKIYHPWRFEAVQGIKMFKNFGEVIETIQAQHGGVTPEIVVTDAVKHKTGKSYDQFRQDLKTESLQSQELRPRLIVFGTGWGVHPEFFEAYPDCTVLDPIYGPLGPCNPDGTRAYNHLSVRSAVAIVLDRLFGAI